MNVTETHYVEGTPFVAILTDENKFMIAMGNQIVSELEFDTLEDVKEYCNEKGWDLLTSVMLILANHLYQTKQLEQSHIINNSTSHEVDLEELKVEEQKKTEKIKELLEN